MSEALATLGKSHPCGCTVLNGQLDFQCDLHKRRDNLMVSRTAIYLEAKIRVIFKDTYLHGIRDEIFTETGKIYGAKK